MNSLSQTNHRVAFLPHVSLLEVFLHVAVFICNLQMNSLSQTNHRVAFLPHADELVESDKPSDGILATCFSFRSLPLCGCFRMQFIVEELVELGKPSGGILATCFSF